jgi:PAS domain S-box-containing protein
LSISDRKKLKAYVERHSLPICIVKKQDLGIIEASSAFTDIAGDVDSLRNQFFLRELEIDGGRAVKKHQLQVNCLHDNKAHITLIPLEHQTDEYGSGEKGIGEEPTDKANPFEIGSSENYFSNIIDSSLNLVVAFDEDLKIKAFNKTAEKITGFSKEEVKGKNLETLLSNEKSFEKILSEVKNQGLYSGEFVLKAKNQEPISVFTSISELNNEKQEKIGFMCSMRDVSETKLWRQKLATSQERYADLFENASDLVQGIRPDGSMIYANKAWFNLLGYSETEFNDLHFAEIIRKEERDAYEEHFKNVLNGKSPKTRVWTLIKNDGGYLLVESKDNLKRLGGKAFSVRSIMRDITKATEAEIKAQEQSAKIQAIFESGSIILWTVDRDIKLTSYNENYRKAIIETYGEEPETNTDPTRPKKKFASLEYHAFWNNKYKEVFEVGKSVSFQTRTFNKEGKVYYREVFLSPIKTNGTIKEVAGMAIDITEKRMAERKMNEQAAKIKTIFNATNHLMFAFNVEGKITSFNDGFQSTFRRKYLRDIKIGDDFRDIAKEIKLDSSSTLDKFMSQLLRGEIVQFETSTTDHNNNTQIHDVSLAPIYNEEGDVIEIAGMSQAITFKKVAEQKLRDQAAKIHSIFDSSAMLIWTLDRNLRIVSYNKVFAEQYRKFLNDDVSIGSNFIENIAPQVENEKLEDLKEFFDLTFKGHKQQFEGEIFSGQEQKRWLACFFNPIYADSGKIKEISCMCYDVTDRRQMEDQMRESIHEKEILLQEVHHRVKNNLQVISSILNLQTSYVKDENSLSILRESQNRIKSMSFIHESLYQTKDFAHIEFTGYIQSLINNLVQSYRVGLAEVELKTEFNKTYLNLDQAIPCGLIVNELISNALKYAFRGKEHGVLYCAVNDIDGELNLTISDDGVGLPPDLDHENSETLGLQLVHTLVDQLGASIELDTTKGTKYLITFAKQ